jgi:CSLREA domain-containing protein
MVPPRIFRPLLVALLSLLALTPSVAQPVAALAATLTFTVTSTVDSHDATRGDGVCADVARPCSLRAAVEEANAQPAASVVTITIPAGTYPLSLGTLVLTRNTITLAGAGASTTVIEGQGSRVLAVAVTQDRRRDTAQRERRQRCGRRARQSGAGDPQS